MVASSDLQILPGHRFRKPTMDTFARVASHDQIPSNTIRRLACLCLFWRPRVVDCWSAELPRRYRVPDGVRGINTGRNILISFKPAKSARTVARKTRWRWDRCRWAGLCGAGLCGAGPLGTGLCEAGLRRAGLCRFRRAGRFNAVWISQPKGHLAVIWNGWVQCNELSMCDTEGRFNRKTRVSRLGGVPLPAVWRYSWLSATWLGSCFSPPNANGYGKRQKLEE